MTDWIVKHPAALIRIGGFVNIFVGVFLLTMQRLAIVNLLLGIIFVLGAGPVIRMIKQQDDRS